MYLDRSFKVSGEPVFLREVKENLFYVVTGFIVVGEGEIRMAVARKPVFREGPDIKEIPTNALGISVEYPSSEYPLENRVKDILRELRTLAGLCNCRYFSYQPFGNDMGRYYGKVDDLCIMRVEPRLFTKIS